MLDKKKYKESTIITHAGQESGEHFGFVNESTSHLQRMMAG